MTSVMIAVSVAVAASSAWAGEADAELAKHVSSRVAAHHADQELARPVLRLVYFHAADAEPLDDYTARWKRILDDIQRFYRDGMARNGYGPLSFDYERDADGNPQFHVVQGRHPSARYDYESGRETLAEIIDATSESFSLRREFTLIVYGLCDSNDDGSYRFHSPYYGEGWSSWQGGACHVADCPILDPARLNDVDESARYVEHNGKFRQTIADFNSKYLGGVAHELGHGLGLPHNAESTRQRRSLGKALMGGGNHTYRRDVWSQRPGSFLSAATCLYLASHPLFVGHSDSRQATPAGSLGDVTFVDDAQRPVLRGSIRSDIEPYAVIVYADPTGGSNYDAQTAVAAVTDGEFEVPLKFDTLKAGELRLFACHVNGGVVRVWDSRMDVRDGRIDTAAISDRKLVAEIEVLLFGNDRDRAVELAKKRLARPTASQHNSLLERIVSGWKTQTTIDLKSTTDDAVSLSTAEWTGATVGWLSPTRNHYPGRGGAERSRFLQIDGRYFPDGLYAHAPSRYTFDLGGKWETFKTTVGFQDGGNSTAVWTVIGDGEPLMTSKPLAAGRHEDWSVDVGGVKTLELTVKSTSPSNARCWTVWGDPRLSR